MASQIQPYNIDGTYPVAGQDNSSQGFRDNFTNIKNNFIFAQNEINDLQSKVLVTSALNGQTISNNMAGAPITAPQLKAWTQAIYDQGVVSTVATLDFTQGNFQKITTGGPISVSFSNWPASSGASAVGYGALRVWFVVGDVAHTIRLPSSVSIGVNDIAGYNADTQEITFDQPGNYVFEFSSIDGGQHYLIFDLARAKASFRDPRFFYNPEVNSAFLIGFGDAFQTALLFEQGQDTVASLGSYNAVSVGDLTQANISSPQIDTSPLGGYSVTSARGNLTIGQVISTHGGDMLGYYNAAHYTGYGTGNTFQQSASITFFSSGTDRVNGLGGNIGFFTTREGEGTANYAEQSLYQAMSINNDQTVQVMGTLQTDGGIVDNGAIVTSLATTNPPAFTANASISTLVIDSINSATINAATIILPTDPVDKSTLTIATVAPITTCNVWAPSMENVKYVPSNTFASGNVSIKLIYNSGSATWYNLR